MTNGNTDCTAKGNAGHMTLGEKLKALLRENNMTQEDLAEQLDVSRQAVGKWVNDRGTPEVNKLIQISDLFGVSLDYLLKEGYALNDAPAISLLDSAGSGYYVSGEMLEGYLSDRRRGRMRIVGAVALVMLANMFEGAGRGTTSRVVNAIYWIFTMAGFALLIWHWFQTEKYPEIKREKLLFDDRVYADFKEKREKGRKIYAAMAITSMALIILGSALADYLVNTAKFSLLGVSAGILEWITDAAGIALTMWAVLSVTAENRIVRNTEGIPRRGHRKYGYLYWAIPVTALAFLIGSVANTWNPMVPLLVLLCALLITLCRLLAERRDSK